MLLKSNIKKKESPQSRRDQRDAQREKNSLFFLCDSAVILFI